MNPSILRSLSPQKPMVCRFFVLCVAAATTASATAQDRLTEREAVSRALARPALADLVEGEAAREEGRGRSAGAYPNLELSYAREQTFGDLGSAEDVVTIAQTFDFGRRALRSDAGSVRASAARREGDSLRLAIAADARERFYEVLYRDARVAALETWRARIGEALVIVARREAAGDAARYDRRRFEREQAVAVARVESELAARDRARGRLASVAGSFASVGGELLPPDDVPPLAELERGARAHPDLAALELRIEAASTDRSAALRSWFPDLRLEAGWKGVDLGAQGRTDGFFAGATLVLPFWDHGGGLDREAEGEARVASAERALREGEIEGELAGSRAEAERLAQAARSFRASMQDNDLLAIAVGGYRGGELGLLELIDAYRGAADDELLALDLELSARRARIELDRVTGRGLP
jgi:cobalt-zinc-cadmium efflux system outer membrane protein